MTDSLNEYGDKLIKTSGSHGADISSQRIDDLDEKSLYYVIENNARPLKGLDIGCGSGIHSVRLSLLGAQMSLIDRIDLQERIKEIAQMLNLKLSYIQYDVRKINLLNLGTTFDFVYTQRFIHYLTYDEARDLMIWINSITKKGSKLYMSASGIHSELGNDYPGKKIDIKNRYHFLSSEIAQKHNILEKVCLYSMDELSELISSHNFSLVKVWTSSFGNIKAIAEKR